MDSKLDTPSAKEEIARILGHIRGQKPGPTVVAIAGMHGNEPSGVEGLRMAFELLNSKKDYISGEIVGIVGNRRALEQQVRYLERDLNRMWRYDQATLKLQSCGGCQEEPEFNELNKTLQTILKQRRGEIIFIDLHTTSAQSPPFLLIGDTLRNRDFVKNLPVPVIIGLEETLNGPLLSYINELGHISMAFEAGQHNDPKSIQNHFRMFWLVVSNAGCLPATEIPDLIAFREALSAQSKGLQSFFELRLRFGITPSHQFVMNPGYINFQPVKKGEVLAKSRFGAVKSQETGRIFMPLYQSQGSDGYFLVRRIPGFWLSVSRVLRVLHFDRVLPILPGVSRHPDIRNVLRVNPKVARFAPIQILHLLGYRKMKRVGAYLNFVKRPFDRKAPKLSEGNTFLQ